MQYLLDVEYAGQGRLAFDDIDGYRCYVESVIDYESSTGVPRDTSAAFFGTRHPLDAATELSAQLMVEPLAGAFAPGGRFAGSIPGLRVESSVGAPSTKAGLTEICPAQAPWADPRSCFLRRTGWVAGRRGIPT